MVLAGVHSAGCHRRTVHRRDEEIMSEALARAARVEHSLSHPYAWRITRDRSAELTGGESAVGVCGPSTAPDGDPDAAGIGAVLFRLMDEGDLDECWADQPGAVTKGHELYGVVYEGLLYDPEGEWPFGPLDDFGRPNDGCIGIKLFDEERGVWEWV
jgi:hypothetical protein